MSFIVPILGYTVLNSPDPLDADALVDHDQKAIWLSPDLTGVRRDCAIAEAVAMACRRRLARAAASQ